MKMATPLIDLDYPRSQEEIDDANCIALDTWFNNFEERSDIVFLDEVPAESKKIFKLSVEWSGKRDDILKGLAKLSSLVLQDNDYFYLTCEIGKTSYT